MVKRDRRIRTVDPGSESKDDDKGQMHTIEGFTAAFIIILAMIYGVQSVAITPTSSSTASQEVELNQYKLADDIVSTTNSNGELKERLVDWNASERGFNGSLRESSEYSGTAEGTFGFGAPVPGDFGETLNQTLTQRGLVYNINLECGGDGSSQTFADNGDPSEHAVTGSTVVTLYEYDTVWADGDRVSLAEVAEDGDLGFYCDRIGSEHNVYNTVEVRLTIWRM